MDLIDALTRFVLPPILGGAGGLIAIYAKIEKERQRVARRRELVTGWRMNLIPLINAHGDWEILQPLLFASPYYGSLRPHLGPNLLRRLEVENRVIVVGESFPLHPILTEIGRIEREWKLV